MKTEVTVSTSTIIKIIAIALAAWALVLIIGILKAPIVWMIIAVVLALGLEPIVSRVERLTGGRRGWALGIVTVLGLALLSLIIVRLVPPMVAQTQALVHSFPEIKKGIESANTPLANFVQQTHVLDALASNQDKIVAFFVNSFSSIFAGSINLIGAVVTIFILLAYFVTGGKDWLEKLKHSRYGGFYRRNETTIRDMGRAVSTYVVGNLIISAVAFAGALVMLLILGISFPLPIAFIYGIFDLIPMVGATLGGIMLVGVALFKSLPAAIIMLIYILVYQQLESSYLSPAVYGKALSLPNALVFVAALIGGVLGGLLGALLAIPIAACIRVGFLAYFSAREQQQPA